MPMKAGTGPEQSQKPGAQSGSCIWVTGTQLLEPFATVSQGLSQQEAGVEYQTQAPQHWHGNQHLSCWAMQLFLKKFNVWIF